jgi:large subunit ribosomal protein L20
MSYSKFMNGLRKANITLDRKALANLAATNPEAFAELVRIAKEVA